MALDAEKEPTLRQAFHDLRELKVDVAYPFLQDVLRDYRHQYLSVDELRQIVQLVERYVFRRAIGAIPTNSINKTFAGLSRALKKDRYLESVQAAFLLLPSYRSFPCDEEFQRKLKERDLYKFRSRGYWLRRLENHGRKERVVVEDYTIEHILPQNDNLSPEWQTELGPEWQRIQQTWMHTLGNLTLTAYNSEYSDRPFTAKKNAVSMADGSAIGFASSPLRLNQLPFQLDGKTYSLGDAPAWTEAAILARAERLAQEAAKVWQAPQLDDDVLEAYKPKVARTGQLYRLEDHPQLTSVPLRELFHALQQAVLALDPCVKE